MEKNIKVNKVFFIVFAVLSVVSAIDGMTYKYLKNERIQVLEKKIEVQNEIIERRNRTINFQDTLISKYEILMIKIIKDE